MLKIFTDERKGEINMKLDEKKLQMILAEKGMMLKDLCESAGIGEITLRNIRQGKSRPRPATIGRIAKALGVDVKDIIEGGE